ncbi:non-hydrolyzing UDP-N-acetylglucosamine 2-epimerase [Alteromonas facilis]|uniref:non-hydrolyzing UDP-N-acetylglucosamine 2-epimerase n=1 Tax=Alteromonas facilis TaxID=2048004 RepID=UPI000C288E93|nr:UDP-N-acetylglucosamine 2-epimerase (non-hydrolyzing) [Alteromonas facilis]
MKNILTIVGARPQFVKAAALSREIQEHTALREFILHTGQHYDANMSQQFFDQLKIPKPHKVLAPDRSNSSAFIGDTIAQIGNQIEQLKPDAVLVYGDTYSTLAGAIAANAHSIPLAHVEAGLRSFNRKMPEEHNRVVTDHLSDLLFCPSHSAVTNLANENIQSSKSRVVTFVGDIMFDALQLFSPFGEAPGDIDLTKEFILMTIHRPVNVDDEKNLTQIVKVINQCAEDFNVIWPMHPRTQTRLLEFGLSTSGGVTVIEPASYLQMLYLLRHCKLVLTDSGGLQKEAFFSGKTCLVARDETEWTELVDCQASVLIGNGMSMCDDITALCVGLPQNKLSDESPYGDGDTRKKIVSQLVDYL